MKNGNKLGEDSVAFQIRLLSDVAGWWRHQPGQRAVGGVLTAHKQHGNAKSDSGFEMHSISLTFINFNNYYKTYYDDY